MADQTKVFVLSLSMKWINFAGQTVYLLSTSTAYLLYLSTGLTVANDVQTYAELAIFLSLTLAHCRQFYFSTAHLFDGTVILAELYAEAGY